MRTGRRVALLAATVAALPATAVGSASVPLERGADGAARIAVDPAGAAAAIYPGPEGVRLRLGDLGAGPEPVPVPRRAVVEGFAMLADARPAVLVREATACSPLMLLLRRGAGAWTAEPVGGPPAAAAVIAIDPAGAPVVLSGGCDGAVAYRSRDAETRAWREEGLGVTAEVGARLTVVAGPGDTAVAGVAGRRAAIMERTPAGSWRRLPLPFTPLAPGETVSAMRVAFDQTGSPVAYLARGAREPLDPGAGTLGGTQRTLSRFEGSAWRSLELGRPDPVDLVAAGLSYAVLQRDGGVRLRGPAGDRNLRLDPLALAVGPEGTPAFVPRAAPRLLGVGVPPALTLFGDRVVPWGAEATLRVGAVGADGPLAGARVEVAGVGSATDASGTARLRVRLTASVTLVATTSAPGRVAPAVATLAVRIVPRAARVAGRVRRAGAGRVRVEGSVAGGVRLPGRLGRLYLVDLAAPGAGFLPGRGLASAPGRGRFRFTTRFTSESRLALFFEGRTTRLRRPE